MRALRTTRPVGGHMVSKALFARALSIASAAALSVVAARVLGPTSAGYFFVVLAFVTGAATLGRWGTDNLALKWVATAGDSEVSPARLLLWMCAGISTVVSIPLFWVVRWVLHPHLVEGSLNLTAVIAAASVIPAALSVTAGAVLRAGGRIASGTIAELGSPFALAAVLLVAFGFSDRRDLVAAVAALTLGFALTAAWSLPLAVRQVGRDDRATYGMIVRRHGRQLSSMMGTSLLFYLLTWAPVLILGAVSDPAEVAYFNVAARIAAFVTLVPSIQTSYLTPRFAKLFSLGDVDRLNSLVQIETRRAMVAGLLLALPVIAFPRQALLLFGADFGPGQDALRVLTVAALIVVALGPVNGLLLTCGFEHFASVLNGAALTIAVVAMMAVAPSGGSFAVSVVSGAVSVVYAAAATWRMRSVAGIISCARISGHAGVSP